MRLSALSGGADLRQEEGKRFIYSKGGKGRVIYMSTDKSG